MILDVTVLMKGENNDAENPTDSLKMKWIKVNNESFAVAKYTINAEAVDDNVIVEQRQCLITPFNCLDDNAMRYYDPLNKQSFCINSEDLVASDVEPYDNEEALEDIREFFEETEKYAQSKYPKGLWGIYPQRNEQGTKEIDFVFTSYQSQSKNFWSGQWISIWHLSETSITGTIKAFVHFHEEGNIQLITSKQFTHSFESETGRAPVDIVKIFEREENSFQIQLSEVYQKLSESTFRRLRRQLPITRQKMDWSRIGAYSLGNELASQKSQN
jgi:capping protein alpha